MKGLRRMQAATRRDGAPLMLAEAPPLATPVDARLIVRPVANQSATSVAPHRAHEKG